VFVNDGIAQLHIVAQSGDGWADLLVFLVVAAFWVIGGLVRVARRRSQEASVRPQGRPRESWQQRLARKAEELQRATEMKRPEPAREPVAPNRPTPPRGQVRVRPGRGGEPVLVYEQNQPRATTAKARHAARQQQAREAVAAARYTAAREPAPELNVGVRGLGPGPTTEGVAGVTLSPTRPELGVERLATPQESVGYAPASIIDYNDPDALRKAILHYEILGTPLSLRDPSEQRPL
jgi:hypothetical protein